MSDIVEEYRQKKLAKLCKEARELCAESSFAAPSGSAAGTLRIEIDFKEQPSEYGGAPYLRMMRAIEAAYPDAKNRTASRMTWHSKPPNPKLSDPKMKTHKRSTRSRTTKAARSGSLKRVVQPLLWKWAGHLSGNRCVTKYRCEQYNANCEKWCNRREGNGPMGYEYYGGGTIFYLDGDKREYKTQKQLIAAIEKRLNAPGERLPGQPKT